VALLDRMESAYKADKNAARPNESCYNFCVVAIGRSEDENKAQKALSILERMENDYRSGGNRYAKPTADIYRTVLRACSSACRENNFLEWSPWEEREKAFKVAMATLEKYNNLILTGDKSHSSVYTQFLWTCYRLLPADEERDAIVMNVFKENPAAEMLTNKEVRKVLHKAVSANAFERILEATRS